MTGAHRWIAAASLMLLLSPLADAQPNPSLRPCEQAMETARQLQVDGIAPFSVASVDRDYGLGGGCDVVALYRILPKEPPRQLPPPPGMSAVDWRRSGAHINPEFGKPASPRFAVRFLRGDPKSAKWLASARWADQTTCPAVLPAMKSLETAVAPQFTADGPKRGGDLAITMDGALHLFRADGPAWPSATTDHRFNLEIRSNYGSPIADWIGTVVKDIHPCLSETEPSFDE